MKLNGSPPIDAPFQPKYLDNANVMSTVHHDQSLPVLEYQDFGRGVNITLGLLFIHTSVGYSAALEPAGHGKTDAGSFIVVLNLTIRIIINTQ